MREFLRQILQYVQSVKIAPKNILEMLILAVMIYFLFAWVKRSRAWTLLRGVVVLLVFVVMVHLLELNVLSYIADRTLNILVIALLILFQPELRAALEQIGQGKYVRSILRAGRPRSEALYSPEVVEQIIDATYVMAQNRTGALIVLAREINLAEYIRTGIRLDAVVSSALLINIFEHNTPLHDGAVIMEGQKVTAATCYLPLSQSLTIEKELGTRHRAAIGLSEVTDSWTIVVSEESGQVALARRGELSRNLRPDELRAELMKIEEDFTLPEMVRKGEKNRRRKAAEAEITEGGEKNE